MTSNRDRAVEVMRSFWHDGRYAVRFDEIVEALDDAELLTDDDLLAQIERVREVLAWVKQAENRAHADWTRTADTHHRDIALAYTQTTTWLRYALGDNDD